MGIRIAVNAVIDQVLLHIFVVQIPLMATGCFSFAFKRIPSFLYPTDPNQLSRSPELDGESSLTRLFRSKSELNVKKSRKNSSWAKLSFSEGDVCKVAKEHEGVLESSGPRYRRVLRDVGSPGELDDSNPHVVHRFSKKYLEKHNIDNVPCTNVKTTLSDSKKHLFFEENDFHTSTKPTISFGNEVEVIEYDKLETVQTTNLYMHKVQLTTGDDVLDVEGDEQNDTGKENNKKSIKSEDNAPLWFDSTF